MAGVSAGLLALTLSGPAWFSGSICFSADDVSSRFYETDPSGSIVERELPALADTTRDRVAVRSVTEQRVEWAFEVAHSARAAALTDVANAPVASRLVPEDLTRHARAVHVSVADYTDAAFALFLARVGQIEGFSVVARVRQDRAWDESLPETMTVIQLPGGDYVWTKDITEIGLDGTFYINAHMGDRGLLRRSLFIDRMRRFYPELTASQLEQIRALPEAPGPPGELSADVMHRYPDILFDIQGIVERDGAQKIAAAIGAARRARVRESMTYLEGGNVLIGTLPAGEPYALVGRDSAAIAKAILEHHAGRPVTEADVTQAMAKDLGVDVSRLFLIEQPGVFHLDLAMTLLAPGTVVLNDAREAFRLQSRWLRDDYEASRPRRLPGMSEDEYARNVELWILAGQQLEDTIQTLQKYTDRLARYEALTMRDLETTGLTVLRVPGRFLHPMRPADRDIMNFLNGEGGANAAGDTYFITQGGDPRAERYVASRLLAPATGLKRLYVAPRLISRDTLWERGGIGCRTKAEGGLDPRLLIDRLQQSH